MMYIGVRSCECLPEQDNYWGSSKHLPLGKKKNLSDLCDKFVLGRFDSREDALQDEIRRHRTNDVAVSKLFWNRAKQTSTGYDTAGVVSWNKGKEFSEESRLKMSESRKGMKLSDETKSKISKGNLGKPKHNADSRRRISEGNLGKVRTAETRAKISKANIGNRHSAKTKVKMSQSRIGLKFSAEAKANMSAVHFTKREGYVSACLNKPQEKITCTHCGTVGGIPSMRRWHFDNCKYKENN